MKYSSIIITLFIVHCTLFIATAQVAINTDNSNPDSSAILDVKSTNKGFLYPRMTTAERDAIPTPSIGLTIFNLDDKCTDIYNGNTWMKECPLILAPDSTKIDRWIQKADFGGTTRQYAVGFSINGKGYIGTGYDGNLKKDFWEYDPITDTWTQKADFGGIVRQNAVGFSINGKGYIGTGYGNGALRKDFWEYDPTTDTWTQKADFGGTTRQNAVGFSINGKGYIGTGFDGSDKKDFWEYDPLTNTWTQKADFSGTARRLAVGFSMNGKGYIGTGAGTQKDFWEYDPITDTWTQKADFSGTARSSAVGFSINGKGYIGTGLDGGGKKDFWEYDPISNTWMQKIDFGGTARYDVVGFSINGKGYIGTGFDNSTNRLIDFWEYDDSKVPTYQPSKPSMGIVINSIPSINDTDKDTKIQVEESADEDKIRFDVAGTEVMVIDQERVGIGVAPFSGYPLSIQANTFDNFLRFQHSDSTDGWHIREQGTNNQDLGFTETGVADHRLVLAAGGNIGIGTANPNTTLEVNGAVTATSFTGDGANLTNLPMGSNLQDTDADTRIQVEESPDEDKIRFDVAGVEAIIVDNSRNVGIGTSSPSRKLHIQTPTAAYGWMHTDNTIQVSSYVGGAAGQLGTESNHNLQFYTNNANRVTITTAGNVGIGTNNPNSTLEVNGAVTATSFTGKDKIRFDAAGIEAMIVDNSGNVGIGTSSPSRKLHIQTPTAAYGWMHTDNTIQLSSYVGGAVGRLGTESNHNLQFYTNNANRVTITTAGNVGIGTNNPNSTLEVNGAVTATSFIGNGLQDTDADTKIQVEESAGEDIIRFDVAGREVLRMDGTFPVNIVANPSSNNSLIKLLTDVNTNAWHLRLQGASSKDLGFTETGVADHRLVLGAGGNIGIGLSNPNVALDVNGSIEYTGTITDVSDSRLKENLLPISAVLSKLLQLQAYSYHMKDDTAKTREYGLLAQEVQKVFPEMVSTIDAEGEYLGLSYIQLIPILIEGMKEQQAVINQLTTENGALKTQMQTQNQEVKVRLAQIEALLSQKEIVETNTTSSEK